MEVPSAGEFQASLKKSFIALVFLGAETKSLTNLAWQKGVHTA